MNFTGLDIRLRLAYPPISNYDFTFVRTEKIVQQLLAESMLYIIVQRPLMTFENVIIFEDELTFEIHKQSCTEVLMCKMPIRQTSLFDDISADLTMEIGWHDKERDPSKLPWTEVDGLKFFQNGDFSSWLTPERFIYHWLTDKLVADVKGNYLPFITYDVHYVGKATNQPIWRRLDGHNTLQKILSIVTPQGRALPTHELCLLLFDVSDVVSVGSFIPDDPDNTLRTFPTKSTIALDAEKLLVQTLQPEFNDPSKRFPGYPISTDGLSPYNFGHIVYQVRDELRLKTAACTILGAINSEQADIFHIENNGPVKITRQTN
ncbi:hypothetical protein D0C36_20020 [Mucilaginibacter conchicola]|uniref:Uncharacterized protein n=1 Tax=Mucilaginibacter conchicola TaxID=2303333 RepID=A0A372NS98_9SPHI|nr:hypothetical protein [Mucilaginibacter conchicola]RFZ91225.1 hypothetical protein D0C36_20020 [Mucilaginibacter conchicola]